MIRRPPRSTLFPTRRSSDLLLLALAGVTGFGAWAEARYREWVQPRIRQLPELCECWSKRDRKSTRLNSSHSQISYAVFCLKKKKPKPACYTVMCKVRTDLYG